MAVREVEAARVHAVEAKKKEEVRIMLLQRHAETSGRAVREQVRSFI